MWNVTEMDKGKEVWWKPQREHLPLSLPGTLKRQSLKDVTFHTPSHTWNTQRLMHYSWLQWVNEKDAALSIQEPFPAVMLWVKEENKSPWCSFYTRRQSDVNFFFNERGDKVVWQAILIKARWPQQGAAAPQHMRDVPQFSQQHMYECICECVCLCECGCVTLMRQWRTFIMRSVEELWRGSVESNNVRAEVSKREGCCWTWWERGPRWH